MGQPCCGTSPPGPDRQQPGYRVEPFVQDFLDTGAGRVPVVATALTWADFLGAAAVRLGVGRSAYRVAPGLYAVGRPDDASPVVVTANYKLTFDAVRRELAGRHLWLLVLDTRGVNVWCAAGKGTFGTAEVVGRVRQSGLEAVVAHRRLILPQLGAPGVAAHEVRQGCGFGVEYGPVRAADLPAYLDAGAATAAMRRVAFPLAERLAVALVEVYLILSKPRVWLGLGLAAAAAALLEPHRALERAGLTLLAPVLGFVCGCFVVPALLPLLATPAFALKGAIAGLAGALLLAAMGLAWAESLGLGLVCVAVASWFSLNFTGSTTFTSPSGVERELRRYLPWQLGLAASGLLLWLAAPFTG